MSYPKINYEVEVHGVYKLIPYTQGRYGVTKKGHVISFLHKNPKVITGKIDKDGYRQVQIYLEGRKLYEKVCKLVMITFQGEREEGQVICHNNGDPSDDSFYNLRYDSQTNNLLDRKEHGTLRLGENNHNSKITDEDAIYILNSKEKTSTLSRRFNISPSTVGDIRKRRTWKHLDKDL